MTEEETPASGLDEPGPDMSAQRRQQWIDRGFEPDMEIKEYFGCFSLEDAKRSMFESTRSTPVPVYLIDDRDGSDVRIPVVIDLIRPSYLKADIGESDLPNWYFEGWVVPLGWSENGMVEIRRIRILVLTLIREFDESDMFEWQYISKPAIVPKPIDYLDHIKNLGLSPRVHNALTRHNEIRTISELAEYGENDLFELQQFGPKALEELRAALAPHGITIEEGWKKNPPNWYVR